MAWAYAVLIAYASLYPFVPWRIPGVPLFGFLVLPWPRYWTAFDLVANLLGYIPLGALVFGAVVRSGGRPVSALWVAFSAGTAWSFAMELLQNFLPHRVASNVDLGLNSLGTLIGAALGWRVQMFAGVERWQVARDRWFIARSAGGLALLLLWPIGMLFPLPVPLAQGQVLAQLQEGIAAVLSGTSVAPWVQSWADAELDRSPLSPAGEFALIALGLLAPCLVAFSVSRAGWRRLVLVLGAAALGALATTLSTALNFGPQHMFAWSTPQALAALVFAIVLASVLAMLPRRAAAGVGLMALTALVTVVAQAPADPFFAQSLQAWEQGRFIRFYGVARWVGWLWPYVAIVYLLARLGARDERETAAPAPPPKMPP
ncbi:VanZ-like domain-containing protein OS=Rhizobacter sp. Root404 OX=1736528 GN=ASC76_12195 PE=4 SV=1 [Rhizobacter fulvus]|jgi:VanZ family protein